MNKPSRRIEKSYSPVVGTPGCQGLLFDRVNYFSRNGYLELMRHWDSVLPGRILRVWYEDVVDDLEGSVRRMLEFCGLECESACVEFYKTERIVQTASSEQVRRPIFRDGLFQWRNYEPWLGPLRNSLGDALIRYLSRNPAGIASKRNQSLP